MSASSAKKFQGLGLKDEKLFRQQAYINGQWVDADSGRTVNVTNPATQEIIGTVPVCAASETRRAIEAAQAAWPSWRALVAKQRHDILMRWANLIVENIDDLSRILTIEMGKPLDQAKGEILSGVAYVEWMAQECRRIYGDIIPTYDNSARIMTVKQPVGVTAAITPWNFPSSMITRKTGAALAAGCPVVIKPSELTPYSALALAELAARAGIPAGVFNIVTGSAAPIGKEMCENPIVRKLGFTGSTPVGKMLYAQCADTVKKISLELGGNAPFIVFEDADLDKAVPRAIASKFRNSGQTCICANRIFVQEKVYDAFAEKFVAAVKKMKIGNGLEAGVDMGPLIVEKGVEKAEEHVADATKRGAKILAGGKRHALGGLFFEPTVLTDMTTEMQVFREETFSPVAPLYKFRTEEEVVRLANDTEYGLAAYFETNDMGRIWRVGEGLEYGMVSVNGAAIATAQAPFGGFKESGIGREGSKYGIDEFLEIKQISIGGI